MSDYGLKCWNANGSITLDVSSTISRLRFTTVASADVTGSIILPDIDGKSTTELSLAQEEGSTSHFVIRIGTKIRWTVRGNVFAPSSQSQILVYLYD